MLLAHGHPDASAYPLGMVADEAQLVSDRINQQSATDGVILHSAAVAIMAKDGAKQFQELIKKLTPETD